MAGWAFAGKPGRACRQRDAASGEGRRIFLQPVDHHLRPDRDRCGARHADACHHTAMALSRQAALAGHSLDGLRLGCRLSVLRRGCASAGPGGSRSRGDRAVPSVTALIAVTRAGERPPPAVWIACLIGVGTVLFFAVHQGAGQIAPADGWLVLVMLSVGMAYVEGGRVSRELGGTTTLGWAMMLLAPIVAAPLGFALWQHECSIIPASGIVPRYGRARSGDRQHIIHARLFERDL